jgi:glycosyltransferase involved in cell wall biosynthesis
LCGGEHDFYIISKQLFTHKSKNLKILHIIPSLVKGGAERLVLDICRELMTRKNVEVKLLIFRNQNDFAYSSQAFEIVICPARVIPSITGKAVIEIKKFKQFIDDFSPDIIHSHLFEAEVISREYVLPYAVYFTHAHDNMPQFRNFKLSTLLKKSGITNRYEKHRLLKKYDRVTNYFIANSHHTFSYLEKNLPARYHSRIFELPNAINVSAFSFCKRTLPANELRLISTGSLVPKKNHTFLLEVMKELRHSGCKVHLDLLGDGPLRPLLIEKAKQEGLTDAMTFHGNVDDVFYFLSNSHVYVHPAIYEPFGLAIVEAMATGLPVVSLDAKGNRGIVDDGMNGFMIEKPDAKLFAQKILEIVKDDETYQSFSLHARKKAEQYNINVYTDKLIERYQQTLSER